jgi:hypothetical protein
MTDLRFTPPRIPRKRRHDWRKRLKALPEVGASLDWWSIATGVFWAYVLCTIFDLPLVALWHGLILEVDESSLSNTPYPTWQSL